MTKKTKPRWGFRGVADKVPIPTKATQRVIQNIKKKTGITLEKHLTDRLIESATAYLSNKKVIDNLPRISEVRLALKKVRDNARGFAEVLEQLDLVSRASLNSRVGIDIEATRSGAEMIYYASESALNDLCDKGGPRPKLALRFFISELNEIYKEATGKKAGIPYKRKKYAVIYDEKSKQYIDPETKEVLDEKTTEELWDKEIILPDGPSLRFISCVLQIIDPSITKTTIFSTMKSRSKKPS